MGKKISKIKRMKSSIKGLSLEVSALKATVNGPMVFGRNFFESVFCSKPPEQKNRIDCCFDELQKINKKLDALVTDLGMEYVFRGDLPEVQLRPVKETSDKIPEA